MRDNWRQLALGVGALALLAGIAATPLASAQNTNGAPPPFMGRGMRGGPGGPGPGAAGLPPQALERLGLTEQQRDHVRSIAEGYRTETRTLAEKQRAARQALQDVIQSGVFDEGAVRQQAMAVSDIETDMAVQRARRFSEVFQILSPEQKTRLKELDARRDARSGPRGRGPRGQGPNGRGNVGR